MTSSRPALPGATARQAAGRGDAVPARGPSCC